ncbi:MAG: hypothetical protein MUE85_15255 [Microscillaceae bacterium]|jgi:hypothetical protein|nr:hypothetical protein [Microscillaceae bacterium]
MKELRVAQNIFQFVLGRLANCAAAKFFDLRHKNTYSVINPIIFCVTLPINSREWDNH